jgi:hypothetical protein
MNDQVEDRRYLTSEEQRRIKQLAKRVRRFQMLTGSAWGALRLGGDEYGAMRFRSSNQGIVQKMFRALQEDGWVVSMGEEDADVVGSLRYTRRVAVLDGIEWSTSYDLGQDS